MKRLTNLLFKVFGKGRTFKMLFNISPMYRRTGGRLIKVSDDLQYVKLKLPLNYKTRNYVGTLYGGHMFSCVDGIYMVQLINILGNEYVIWDKSAAIKFLRPGNQTLFAEFLLSDDLINEIKLSIEKHQEIEHIFKVQLVDNGGKVYSEVEKLIYLADKGHYRRKRSARGM